MNFKKKRLLKIFLPIVIGGVLGYSYYYFIGCNNGCVIQSNPYASTIYGALIGVLFPFPSKKQKENSNL